MRGGLPTIAGPNAGCATPPLAAAKWAGRRKRATMAKTNVTEARDSAPLSPSLRWGRSYMDFVGHPPMSGRVEVRQPLLQTFLIAPETVVAQSRRTRWRECFPGAGENAGVLECAVGPACVDRRPRHVPRAFASPVARRAATVRHCGDCQ